LCCQGLISLRKNRLNAFRRELFDPVAADPLMRPELRNAMRGNLPELQVEKEIQPGTPTKTTIEAQV